MEARDPLRKHRDRQRPEKVLRADVDDQNKLPACRNLVIRIMGKATHLS